MTNPIVNMITPAMQECLDRMIEQESLTEKYEIDEDMTTSDAQAVAMTDMIIKYGKHSEQFLTSLPHKEAMRLLDIREVLDGVAS